MRLMFTAIMLVFPFACIAQYPGPPYPGKWVNGNVKKIRSSVDVSASVSELKTRSLNPNRYSVDSFDKEGYMVFSYEVVNGIARDVLKYSYRFDNEGNMTQRLYVDDERGVSVTTTYIYDTAGNMIEEIEQTHSQHYDTSKGSIKYTYVYPLLVTEEAANWKTVYKYNNNGKIIEEAMYFIHRTDLPPTIRKYSYDDKGNKISVIDISKTYTETSDFRYDEHNNVVDEDGMFTEYTYDSRGNWIRCIEQQPLQMSHIDGEPPVQWYRLTVRKIDYY